MEMIEEVNKGILFIRFSGKFNNDAFKKFNEEIDYLLYNQGVSYYTFNFLNIETISPNIISKIQSKLIEIFLSCGKVVMCGLSKALQNKIGFLNNSLYYLKDEREVYSYLAI